MAAIQPIQDASPSANNPAGFPSVVDIQTTDNGITETEMETGNKDVVIRPMVIEDSGFVAVMMNEAFRDKSEHLVGRDGVPRMIQANEEYNKLTADRYHRFFIAEVGGERAGCIQLAHKEDGFKEPDFSWGNYLGCCAGLRFMCLMCEKTVGTPKPQEMYVTIIAVDAKFRGCGVGKALLDRAEQEGRALSCIRMSLDCTTTNRARNLYLRQGYVVARTIDGCCFTSCSLGVRYFYRMEKEL